MKKILTLLFGCALLVGCSSEAGIKKVDASVVDRFQETNLSQQGIYSINDKLIVFQNMNIDPDSVELKVDGLDYTVMFDMIDDATVEQTYVYEYKMAEACYATDGDCSLICKTGENEYPFVSRIVD